MEYFLSGLFFNILELSLHGSLALLLVAGLRFLAGGKLAARYRSFLWFPALFAFLVPIDYLPTNPLALPAQPVVTESIEGAKNYWVTESLPARNLASEEKAMATASRQMAPGPDSLQSDPGLVGSSWGRWLAGLWILGCFVLAVKVWRDSRRFRRVVISGQRKIPADILRSWEKVLEEQQLRRPPSLVYSDGVEVPALAGLYRPAVILPAGQDRQYVPVTLEHIFRHEIAHFRRGDLYFLAFERLVLLLHWFNPLVWFSHRLIREDRELGADASALDRMESREAESYGMALLEVATGCGEQESRAAMVGIFESKKQLAERLHRIAGHRQAGWIAALGIIVALCLVCFFIFGRAEKSDMGLYAGMKDDQALLQAAMIGDVPAMHYYLKSKPDINRTVEWSEYKTALIAAASTNQVGAMKLLLKSGADPRFQPVGEAWTALETAIRLGQKDAIDLLLKHGAVADEEMLAAARGDTDYFRKLFAKGAADIPFKKIHTWTGVAVVNRQVELYHLMLETAKRHPGLYTWDYPHENDLTIAICRGYKDILQETLDTYPEGLSRFKTGPVRIAESTRQTPGMKEWLEKRGFNVPPYPFGEELIDAAGRNDIPRMKKLLDEGADPNYSGEEGWSPVAKASNSSKLEAMKLLLSRGGNPNSVKSPGANWSALTLCSDPRVAELLYAAGADVNGKLYGKDVHIVSYPVYFGETEMVKWFVSKGVDLKNAKTDAPSMLFNAGNAEIAEILVKQGINPNLRDENGETALFQIASRREKAASILEVLLQNGADPNLANKEGYTPLMMAKDGESVEVLLKYGANPNARTKQGLGILEANRNRTDLSYVKALLAHGLKLTPETASKYLFMAVNSKKIEDVNFFLEHGADPAAKITEPGFPVPRNYVMPAAAWTEDPEILKLLLDHGGKPEDGMNAALSSAKSKVVRQLWEAGARNIPQSTYLLSQGATLEELKPLLKEEAHYLPDERKGQFIAGHPFVYACALNRKDVVEFLWPDCQSDLDTVRASLNYAAIKGRLEILELLLSKGAVPTPGLLATALSNSISNENQGVKKEDFVKIVNLLIKAGALKGASGEDRGNIMTAAVFTRLGIGNEEVIRLLVASGLNGNEKSKQTQGRTVLEILKERIKNGYKSEAAANVLALLEASVKEAPSKGA